MDKYYKDIFGRLAEIDSMSQKEFDEIWPKQSFPFDSTGLGNWLFQLSPMQLKCLQEMLKQIKAANELCPNNYVKTGVPLSVAAQTCAATVQATKHGVIEFVRSTIY